MDKYSVLMSVYYKEKPQYLRQSIESIMTQTVMPDEFVIVCDGPLNDELDAVLTECAHKYKIIKLVRLPENVGLGKALNEGIGHCNNEIVARMDSDDVSMPDRMERQLAVFAEKNVDIVSGTVAEFTKKTDNVVTKRVLPENPEEIRRFAFGLLNGVSFSDSSKELHGYSPLPYKRDHFSYPVSSAFCYLLLPLYQSPILNYVSGTLQSMCQTHPSRVKLVQDAPLSAIVTN